MARQDRPGTRRVDGCAGHQRGHPRRSSSPAGIRRDGPPVMADRRAGEGRRDRAAFRLGHSPLAADPGHGSGLLGPGDPDQSGRHVSAFEARPGPSCEPTPLRTHHQSATAVVRISTGGACAYVLAKDANWTSSGYLAEEVRESNDLGVNLLAPGDHRHRGSARGRLHPSPHPGSAGPWVRWWRPRLSDELRGPGNCSITRMASSCPARTGGTTQSPDR